MENLNKVIVSDKKLNAIIADYKEKKKSDVWADFCKKNDLKKVIEQAALAEEPSGRRFDHQRRIRKGALPRFKEELLKEEAKIKTATTFEELLNIVEQCGGEIKWIGELACYDTAMLIGIKLNIHPTKIYMHAGPRNGAKNLLGLKRVGKFLEKDIFPVSLQKLTAHDIEAILCIYWDQLGDDNEFKPEK